jgi:DNA-binding NarL/FixJ family response regulator
LLREALARILVKRSDISVVGSGQLGPEAVLEIVSAGPSVVLLNPAAPALAERDYLEQIRNAAPRLKVVLFGMEESEEAFFAAVRVGVVGYVLKDASACDLVAAVRAAAQGEAVCPPRLCLALFHYLAQQANAIPSFHLRMRLGLTRREQQLIPLIAQGLTNKEIAAQLNLSEQTVKNHIHRMLQKAGASGRLQIVEMCRVNSLAV